MKRMVIISLVVITLAVLPLACTNMNKTEQGIVSGGAIGALGGMGIAAIAGGSGSTGALVGAGLGALAGGIVGHNQ